MQKFFPKKQEKEDLALQIEQLKKEIEKLHKHGKTQEIHYHFQVEQIQVEQVNLEQLLFQLEKMHTEHLNGTLNFGNNFGLSRYESQKLSAFKQEKEQKMRNHTVNLNLRSRGDEKNNEST